MNNIQDKRYIPEGYELSWDDQDLGVQVYYKEAPVCAAICFVGRAVKPTWHYRFKNAEQRNTEVVRTFKNVADRAERKAKIKADRIAASANHGVKVGDIFKSSWGYDQTNIDYYEVIAVSGKTATVCEIGRFSESDGYLQGNCVPAPGKFIGKPFKKLIQKYSETSEAHFKVNSFSSAWKIEPVTVIEGKPIFKESHWTAYA